MEAVTIRGSLGLIILCTLVVSAGTAAATYPLPPAQHTVTLPDADLAVVREGIDEKHKYGERCLPRDLFCVGPFEPIIQVGLGRTGARVVTDDVWVMGGHDPAKKERYGPYAVPTITDDLRFCFNGCFLPDPFYVAFHANATVHVYAHGEMHSFTVDGGRSIDSLHPDAIPRAWCYYAQYTVC